MRIGSRVEFQEPILPLKGRIYLDDNTIRAMRAARDGRRTAVPDTSAPAKNFLLMVFARMAHYWANMLQPNHPFGEGVIDLQQTVSHGTAYLYTTAGR